MLAYAWAVQVAVQLSLARAATALHPELGTTTYGRDILGNLTSSSTNGSPLVTYQYDTQNRLIRTNQPNPADSVSKIYYPDGKLQYAINNATSRYFEYDADDHLTLERLSVADRTYDFNYTYSTNGDLSLMRYPSGQLVNYAPNAIGHPTQAAPFASDIDFHPLGQLKRMRYANGIVTTVDLNVRQLPQRLISEAPGNRVLDLSYEYSGNDNITKITDAVDPANSMHSLVYDEIDQLIAADGSTQTRRFSYDGTGNLIARTENDKTLNYSYTANKLTSVTGAGKPYNLQYDVYGNVVHNGSKSFLYNALGQMVCSACGQANEARHTYDGLGMRVRSIEKSVNTYFVYGQSGQMLLEVTPQTAQNEYQQKEYYYVAGRQIAFKTTTKSYTNLSIDSSAVQNPDGSVVLIARVNNPNVAGVITFKQKLVNGTVLVLGSANIINGVASITTNLPLENVQIIVSYDGNADFMPAENLFNVAIMSMDWLPAVLALLDEED